MSCSGEINFRQIDRSGIDNLGFKSGLLHYYIMVIIIAMINIKLYLRLPEEGWYHWMTNDFEALGNKMEI